MEVGVIVEKLKFGVASCCVACGEVMIEGVEAWSVANRSGVGAEADRLHPVVNTRIRNVKINLVLCIFSLDE